MEQKENKMTTIEKEFVKQLNNVLQANITYNLRKSILLIYLDIILDERIELSKEITVWALMKIYTISDITPRQQSNITKHKNGQTFADIFYEGSRIGTTRGSVPVYEKATDIFVEHFKKLCDDTEKKDFQQWLDTNYREENVTWSRDNENQKFTKTVYPASEGNEVSILKVYRDGLVEHLKMDAFQKSKQRDIEYYKQVKKNIRRLYKEGLISMNAFANDTRHINKMLEKLGYEC